MGVISSCQCGRHDGFFSYDGFPLGVLSGYRPLNNALIVSWPPNALDTGYMTVHWRLGYLFIYFAS